MVSVSIQITKEQLSNLLQDVMANDPSMLQEVMVELTEHRKHQYADDAQVDEAIDVVFARFDNALRALA